MRNCIYIIPTEQKPGTVTVLKSELFKYLGREVSIHTRGSDDEDMELIDLSETLDIGEECEFRFFNKKWNSSFIGKVLIYGWYNYDDDKLSKVFRSNLDIGFVIQIYGGPDSLENFESEEIYFGVIKIMTELYSAMIFIDPEGNTYNNEFYNKFEKRLYTFDDFQNKNRYQA